MSRIGGGTLPGTWTRPAVAGDLPGPRSAELLARQDERQSNTHTYPAGSPSRSPRDGAAFFAKALNLV